MKIFIPKFEPMKVLSCYFVLKKKELLRFFPSLKTAGFVLAVLPLLSSIGFSAILLFSPFLLPKISLEMFFMISLVSISFMLFSSLNSVHFKPLIRLPIPSNSLVLLLIIDQFVNSKSIFVVSHFILLILIFLWIEVMTMSDLPLLLVIVSISMLYYIVVLFVRVLQFHFGVRLLLVLGVGLALYTARNSEYVGINLSSITFISSFFLVVCLLIFRLKNRVIDQLKYEL